MSDAHPNDEQLLLYAEGERPAGVAEHVGACATCRQAVADAETGREALRTAPLLELPAGRRETVLAALPGREREPRLLRRRFLAVALPLVALAAVVAAVGLIDQSDPERAAEELREDAAREAPAALEADAAQQADPVRSVAGPAEEVAEALRARGFDAEVVDGAVEVTGASWTEVEEALQEREDGDVEVRVR
jgi:hypothetical protein